MSKIVKNKILCLLLCVTFLVISICCGGSGGDSVASVTIGGTGQGSTSKPIELTAPIDSFGSIIVGGIQFDTNSANTIIEGQSGNTDSLQAGMWVHISGNLGSDETLGSASNISYESRIAGLIQSASSNVITVGGVTIILQDDTQIDNNLNTPLAVNDDVKVSGSYLEDNFLATFIGPNPNLLRVVKSKTDLQATLSSNTTNILQIRLEQSSGDDLWTSGNLIFDFSGLGSDNLIDSSASNQTLSRGKHVLVHSTTLNNTTQKVTLYQVLELLEKNDQITATGTLSSKDSQSKTFVLDFTTYKFNKFTRFSDRSKRNFGFKDLEVGVRYKINYVLDNNNNRVARRIRKE
jgi:hypothetical protein